MYGCPEKPAKGGSSPARRREAIDEAKAEGNNRAMRPGTKQASPKSAPARTPQSRRGSRLLSARVPQQEKGPLRALFNMSRTLSRGRKRPGPIFGWTWSLFYMVNPRASPPSRVSVRRPSCSLISARGARALGIPLLRLGPSSSSESRVVLAGPAPARRKKSGNGPQRPRTRRPGDRRPLGGAAGR